VVLIKIHTKQVDFQYPTLNLTGYLGQKKLSQHLVGTGVEWLSETGTDPKP